VAGSWSDNDSWSAIAGQTLVGFIPFVGQAADARDITAAAKRVRDGEDGAWGGFGLAALAVIPGLDFLKAGRGAAKAKKLLKHAGPGRSVVRLAADVDAHAAKDLARITGHGQRLLQNSALAAQQSMLKAAQLGGRIDYGGVDDLGRPLGIRAIITKGMLGGDNIGSGPKRSIKSPGYEGLAANHAKGHLLANQLGGSGDVYDNLVTLFQRDANHPQMSNVERAVRDAVAEGRKVFYRAIPIYNGPNPIPEQVRILVRSIKSDPGVPALRFTEIIENVSSIDVP